MATNEQNRPPEAATPGGTTAAGGAASAFERPVPPVAQPEVAISPPAAAPEVTIHRAVEPRNRLVSLARSAGHYLGATVRAYRTTRREGISEQAKRMVRQYPSSLGGAAVAGYLVGRVLRGRV